MRVGNSIKNLRRFKLLFFFIILFLLSVIPLSINADVKTEIVEQDNDIVFLDNGGHGLYGIRGGIVFSPEDTQGYGYSHEEVVFNLWRR